LILNELFVSQSVDGVEPCSFAGGVPPKENANTHGNHEGKDDGPRIQLSTEGDAGD
jgi:hypothetical protein